MYTCIYIHICIYICGRNHLVIFGRGLIHASFACARAPSLELNILILKIFPQRKHLRSPVALPPWKQREDGHQRASPPECRQHLSRLYKDGKRVSREIRDDKTRTRKKRGNIAAPFLSRRKGDMRKERMRMWMGTACI